MSESPVEAPRASWLRRLSQRQRRPIAWAAAVIVVVGAFLQWGPIGLGSGPLALQMGGCYKAQPIQTSGSGGVHHPAVQLQSQPGCH